MTKMCPKCQRVLPATPEHFHRNGPYLRSVCKACTSELHAERGYAHAKRRPSMELRVEADKKLGEMDLRAWIAHLRQRQQLAEAASWSQRTARIQVDTDAPLAIMCWSDQHIGALGADYEGLLWLTELVCGTPGLYVALLGDPCEMAIKPREGGNVGEMASQILSPAEQVALTRAWLEEIAPKVLWATWDNHTVEREEAAIGWSPTAELLAQHTVYFSGIGHVELVVGAQTYRIASSHRFRGRSANDPVAGPKAYLRTQAQDCEVAVQGDTHVPGIAIYWESGRRKMAVNAGTHHLQSAYAMRHFSLRTSDAFPVMVFHPREHYFLAYPTIQDWLELAR